jgi:hypothetical protein
MKYEATITFEVNDEDVDIVDLIRAVQMTDLSSSSELSIRTTGTALR